jgi:tetratricopeptide (TPR) repeat protein
MAKFRNTGDFATAEKHFLRAIEINSSQATAHHWYSVILGETGKYNESLREIEIAARLAPRSAVIQHSLGEAYLFLKRYEEAIAQFDKVIEIENTFAAAYYRKSLVQQYRGEYDAAVDTYRRARIYSGGDENEPLWLLMQAHAYAAKGQRNQALNALNRYLQGDYYVNHPDNQPVTSKESGTNPRRNYQKDPNLLIHEVALVYNLLGDTEQTFKWLNKIEIKKPGHAKFHTEDPRFANLHNDPRFTALTKRWLLKK